MPLIFMSGDGQCDRLPQQEMGFNPVTYLKTNPVGTDLHSSAV
jgi:hypothetical protein